MIGSYNVWLVGASIFVACLASYGALELTSRIDAALLRGSSGLPWIGSGALSMGSGIWSMHFIGMLAFSLPIPMAYDIGITLASLGVAVVLSGFALWVVSLQAAGRPDLALE